MKHLQWILAAAASAYACYLAVHHATPIDRALPFVAVVVVLVAWLADEIAITIAVPLLIAGEIVVADESTRLLAFGVIVAAVIGYAVHRATGQPGNRATGVVVGSILLLRWIPLPEHLLREIFLLALAIAILYVLGRTPFAMAVAIITVLITPAVPLRTLALPMLVLLVASLARFFGMPRIRLALLSTIAIAFVLTFFAWSGIVARAFPYFLKVSNPIAEKYTVNAALAPSQSATLHVPDGARALIVSGANVPKFRRGTALGNIHVATGFSPSQRGLKPGSTLIEVRVGDAADWGYMRRDFFYGSHNPLPRDPVGKIRGYGYLAWVDGAGRVALPRGAKIIRVTADARLPKDASLQVEGFEIVRQ